MLKRWIPVAAVLCVLSAALPLRAEKKDPSAAKDAAPAVVVRLQSIDGLLKDFRTIAKLAGQEEAAKQVEAMINARIGEKGLEGIDTKRPLGVYGNIGEAGVDSTFVGMIPIADEKAVLGLLETMNFKAEKGKDDVYTVKKTEQNNLPVDVYFRFANKYVYVTALDKTAIDKDKLLLPAQVLPADQVGTLSATLRLDQIPEKIRDMGLTQLELSINQQKEKKDKGETAAQTKFKEAMLDAFYNQVSTILKEGREINFRLDLSDSNNDMSVKLSLTGKDGSTLAKDIAALADRKSLFAGIPSPNSVISFLVNVPLPTKLHETLGPVIDEGIAKEADPGKKAVAEKLLKAITPSLKAGEFDGVFDLSGPTDKKLYTLAMGLKLKDGTTVEKAIRDAAKQAPEADRNKLKFDADKAGSINIHRADMGETDADIRKVLGTGPAYFAFREDAVLITAGDNALPALKKLLAIEPQTGKPLQFTVSVARLAPLMSKDNPEAPRIADKVFAKNKDSDKIRFTVEGGKALTLRFDMKTALIEFFTLLDKEKKGTK